MSPALAPAIDPDLLTRRRQLSRTEPCGSEATGEALGGTIVRSDAVNHVRPVEYVECIVHRGDRCFHRHPLPLCIRMQPPADLVARPPQGTPWPNTAQPQARFTIQDRKHSDPGKAPGARHGHEYAPGRFRRLDSAQEARGVRVRHHLRPTGKVGQDRRPQNQSPGFENGDRRRFLHCFVAPPLRRLHASLHGRSALLA